MLACREFRGAEPGSANVTGHALFRASVRLRLKKIHRLQRPPRIHPLKFKTVAVEGFRLELHNRYAHLAELGVEGAEIISVRNRSYESLSLEAPMPGLDFRPHSGTRKSNAAGKNVRKLGTHQSSAAGDAGHLS